MQDQAIIDGVPVTFDIVCRTSRDGPGVRHPVTVHPDGSVETPHDLALERIAVAMGGYLTCLELVDRFVPCVRDLWLHRRRVTGPGIVRRGGRWRVADRVPGCPCAQASWRQPEDAAEHLRQTAHWAHRHGVSVSQASVWFAKFEHGVAPIPAPPRWQGELADQVIHRDDPAWLWAVGISPESVHAIHTRLGVDGPLRRTVYLDVACGAVDVAWLARFASYGPDAVAWASATRGAHDGRRPDERIGWLAAGVNRRLVLPLLGGPYTPDDARRIADETGLTASSAAHVLVDWLAARCEPSVDDVVRLIRMDLSRYAPSAGAVAALRERAPLLTEGLSTTRLGMLLVEEGTVPAAIGALRRACECDEASEGAA